MKIDQQINDLLAIFASAMLAVLAKLIRATERPSKSVVIGEVLIGLGFCFFLAPALQEHYDLSVKTTCAVAWVSSYFSGMLLKASEDVIKEYLTALKSWAKAFSKKGGKDE